MSRVPSERVVEILLVEDHEGDIRLTKEAFKDSPLHTELSVVQRGAEALDFLHQRDVYRNAPRPDIVLLDYHLPGMSGIDVLDEIKTSPALEDLPVVLLTGSQAQLEELKRNDEYATAYSTKPIDPDEFADLVYDLKIVSDRDL